MPKLHELISSPSPQWLFANRRTLEQARADCETLRALETGKLVVHPSEYGREPWKTLFVRRDAAL